MFWSWFFGLCGLTFGLGYLVSFLLDETKTWKLVLAIIGLFGACFNLYVALSLL